MCPNMLTTEVMVVTILQMAESALVGTMLKYFKSECCIPSELITNALTRRRKTAPSKLHIHF